jgi:hypothetical protein
MLQLLKVWSLQDSLSRAKEKESETRSINTKKRNLQSRLSRMEETSSKGNKTILISCTYLVYLYLLEDNVFQEELYLWKNNKIRMDIIR